MGVFTASHGCDVLTSVTLGLALVGCPTTTERPAEPLKADAPAAVSEPVRPSPAHLPAPIPSPERNLLTPAGVALGRHLFYEPMLSDNGEVSCATCHQQARAFTDGKQLAASGVSGQTLKRHAPTLANVAWVPALFWDGGGSNLESQAFAPLTHPDEMALYLRDAAKALAAHPSYPALFEAAFDDGVTLPNIVRALAQFQRTLVSATSRYDDELIGKSGAALTAQERAGEAVFEARCAGCHPPPLFTDQSFHNNGLDDSYSDEHEHLAWGRGRITLKPQDKGAFKTPTLRNVALTAPYMHDGRLATLAEVFDHYRSGVKDAPTLDARLRQADGARGIPISAVEEAQLTAFLHTLTDEGFVTDARHGPP